jgi:tetratricopeptide (TPR) repeat protein
VDTDLITENEAFWNMARTQVLTSVENELVPPASDASQPLLQRMMARLHIPQEERVNALYLGAYYSRSLDFWGVELQRAGELTNATLAFQTALALNTNNIAAQINLELNGTLRAGQRPVVDPSQITPDRMGRFDSISAAITECGPFDDPSFCFIYGLSLAQNGNYRQAVAPFARVCELAPDYWPAVKGLSRVYAFLRRPDQVLVVLQAPMKRPEGFSMTPADLIEMHMLASSAYFQKNDLVKGSRLLDAEIANNPTNDALSLSIEEIYASRGMYTNAIAVIDRRLETSPDDVRWLYAQGNIYNAQKKYDSAIAPLNRLLTLQKDNNQALYELGVAYLGESNLDEARTDFAKIQETDTNSYQVAYQLGEIAWRQHDTNEAIRNYQAYLSNAPTNTAEAVKIEGRLQELEPAAPNQ